VHPLAWTASAFKGPIGAGASLQTSRDDRGAAERAASVREALRSAKGAWRRPGPRSATAGRNAFGYRWVDSDAPRRAGVRVGRGRGHRHAHLRRRR
jgi:hypothetical protein